MLRPTRIYVKPLLAAIASGGVRGLAHITGGGLTENLPRVLPDGLGATVDLAAWTLPPVFQWLRAQGGLSESELLKTFNSGVGMVVVAEPDAATDIEDLLRAAGEDTFRIGKITKGQGVEYAGTLT